MMMVVTREEERRIGWPRTPPFDRSGRMVNPKASLRFDSFAEVIKGNLDGPVIVPNDLEKSRLYTVLNLPEDDDLFMPPKGGPMDQEQKDIIKRWIGHQHQKISNSGKYRITSRKTLLLSNRKIT